MYFFGFLILATTIGIIIFKKEESSTAALEADHELTSFSSRDEVIDESKFSCIESYKVIWNLLKVKPVRELGFLILTSKVSQQPCFINRLFRK